MSRLNCTQQIKDIADARAVAELLGIQVKQMGSNISMLCPVHNDKHFGSCFITSKGFKCFSCQASGDVFDLVAAYLGCDFNTAKKWVAKHYGIAVKDRRPSPKILKRESCELIGLKPVKSRIEHIVGMFSEEEYSPELLREGEFAEWHPQIDDAGHQTGYYLIKVIVDSHPLHSLYKNNNTLYKSMIFNKALEATKKFQDMKNHFAQSEETHPGIALFTVATKEFRDECLKIVKKFDNAQRRSYSV